MLDRIDFNKLVDWLHIPNNEIVVLATKMAMITIRVKYNNLP